jgi:hypothetical protein
MGRRIRETYTIMIARTDKPPVVFSVRPVLVWTGLAVLGGAIATVLFLCWHKDSSSTSGATSTSSQVSAVLSRRSDHSVVL